MDNDSKFIEQEAPVKNTDSAFVEVGPNGSPVVPSDNDKKINIEKDDSAATSDKR